MNKLQLQPGGHPLTIEDLLFMQQANIDGFEMVIRMFADGNTPCIITGCQKTAGAVAGTVDISQGAIFHNGELWFTIATLGITDSPNIYFAPSITYQAPTPVTYANAALVNVKEIRVMEIGIGNPVPTGGVAYTDCIVLTTMLKRKSTPWITVGSAQCPFDEQAVSVGISGHPLEFQKNVIGDLVFRGRLYLSTIPANTYTHIKLFTLPFGYRPNQNISSHTFLVILKSNPFSMARVLIIPDGSVILEDYFVGNNYLPAFNTATILFDGFRFQAED